MEARLVENAEGNAAMLAGKLYTLSLKPETRNPKPETRNPKSETRHPTPETREDRRKRACPSRAQAARAGKPSPLNPNTHPEP